MSPQTYIPKTDDEIWAQALRWLEQHDCPLHSKTPREPPEGFIRLAYLVPFSADAPASGPNYLYIRPEWVRNLHDAPVSEPKPLWHGGPLGRDGPWISFTTPGSFGSRDSLGTAHITPESVEALRALGIHEKAPPVQQGSLF